ncbi:hypothetical protein GCM10027452_43240 [Micromonospora halotolerans]
MRRTPSSAMITVPGGDGGLNRGEQEAEPCQAALTLGEETGALLHPESLTRGRGIAVSRSADSGWAVRFPDRPYRTFCRFG